MRDLTFTLQLNNTKDDAGKLMAKFKDILMWTDSEDWDVEWDENEYEPEED